MFLSSGQADYSSRQQRLKLPAYKSDKSEVSSRYFVVAAKWPARFDWDVDRVMVGTHDGTSPCN